ncbi:MAG: sigma 54-interacting transcriptional regulator [Pseudomonadota bacterium]|nr:sigma 54-interacting transcriptional regulator [Pseudomonadota bacterium]
MPHTVVDYTADLHDLAALVAGRANTEDVLDRALGALTALIPHDLAVVFRLDGARLRAVAATGSLASPQVRAHNLDLARYPTIRRALELRIPIALAEHNHAGEEGDPFDGLLDFPHGHACMVVPLFAGDKSLGIITMDGRGCGMYPPEHVRLAGVYGQLVSLALLLADQASLLDRYRHQLKEQNQLLTEETGGAAIACRRLEASRSPRMAEVVRLAQQVAPAALPVLIRGETGTGKEVLAHAIHGWSPRVDGPFVKLNCSAIPENLVESELFGHVKGSFSGADRDRRGRFVTANGGTLLLDEIGDMPLAAQAKLLRVLQEGTFEPVGADRTVRVDVRVIAATHVDLEKAVAAGRFRQDLYYRLAVFPLRIPPLRERPEDIVPIALEALDAESARSRRGPWTLPAETRTVMERAPWPGNVRELVNALERATILQRTGPLSVTHLGLLGQGGSPATPPPSVSAVVAAERLPTFEENERRYFATVLEHVGGKLYGDDGAAVIVDLPPTTLRSRLVKLGLR